MAPQSERPDPDALLQRIEAEEKKSRRGKLKIFFGGCAGVGKTYAMLSAAQEALAAGQDVVAGIVETHGRPETQKLFERVPSIPPLQVEHRGVKLKELDVDAARERKPAILLVDELAHTNAPGLRHPKRWNDVDDLLDSGIDVYTTLNVQHLESLSDMVAGVTGVWVKETVPDAVFDSAEDIILVDVNADELLKRLHEGKVYISPEAKKQAAENFFRKKNIIALRELALRRVTERVDAQMSDYAQSEGVTVLPVGDKIMVCVGADPLSARLVRAAKRFASSLRAPWTAAYVENARHYRLNTQGREAVSRILRMAERIGGKTIVLQGSNAVEEIIAYANTNRVTKIIVGKPNKSRWRDILYGSLAEKIIRRSGDIDVYVITGDAYPMKQIAGKSTLRKFKPLLYAWAVVAVAICTAIGVAFDRILEPKDQMLIYLIGNIVVAAQAGRGPAIFYALLSAACFNFFFIPPLYTLQIYDRSYWMTLAVMLATSIIITSYASRLRLQAIFSRRRERDTQSLYALTREIAATRGHKNISEVTARHLHDLFGVDVTIWLPDSARHLHAVYGELPYNDSIRETALIQWSFNHGHPAGRGTDTMPSATGFYLPLVTGSDTVGVLGLLTHSAERQFRQEEIAQLETFANVLATALARANDAEAAEKARVEIESEKLRSTLLSSVSHDLRTPLASITGASSSIALDAENLPRDTIKELARSINSEASRLSRIVTNLLDVTNLEAGTVTLNKQPYYLEELVGAALSRLEPNLQGHKIETRAEKNLPMTMLDGVLIEQMISNLMENAIKYTPAGTTIIVSVVRDSGKLRVSVEDSGPGIPPGEEGKIFDKFYTISRNKQKGTGLGLAICSGIARAHGGSIKAENRKEGGARFSFWLPIEEPVKGKAA